MDQRQKKTVLWIMIIRRRYHYGLVYLDPNVIGGQNMLCGQKVSTICQGRIEDKPFLGFTESLTNEFGQTCLITGVTGFTDSNSMYGHWKEYSHRDVLLGIEDRGIKMVIRKGEPIKLPFQFTPPSFEKPKNVVTLKFK
jgi:hypothetical protein